MRANLVALITVALSAVVSAFAWGRLPDSVPVHFGLDGQPDRFGPKAELVLGGPLLLLFFWGLFAALGAIDPKVRAHEAALEAEPDGEAARLERKSSRSGREAIVVAALLLVFVVHVGLLAHGAGLLAEPGRLLTLALAAFLLVAGNFMGRVRPNWFIGIRTPWTLADDGVWQRTHRLAGKLMVAAGALLVPLCLLLPGAQVHYAAPGLFAAALLPPIVASYLLWRRRITV